MVFHNDCTATTGGILSLPSYTSWQRYTTPSVRIPRHIIRLGADNASVSTGPYTTCCGSWVPRRSDDGLTIIQEVVHAYTLTSHSSSGYSPFYLMFGKAGRQLVDLLLVTVSSTGSLFSCSRVIGERSQPT